MERRDGQPGRACPGQHLAVGGEESRARVPLASVLADPPAEDDVRLSGSGKAVDLARPCARGGRPRAGSRPRPSRSGSRARPRRAPAWAPLPVSTARRRAPACPRPAPRRPAGRPRAPARRRSTCCRRVGRSPRSAVRHRPPPRRETGAGTSTSSVTSSASATSPSPSRISTRPSSRTTSSSRSSGGGRRSVTSATPPRMAATRPHA